MRTAEKPFIKPNIGALWGKVGMSIIETIRNTPAPDRSKLNRECRELEKQILAAEENDKK